MLCLHMANIPIATATVNLQRPVTHMSVKDAERSTGLDEFTWRRMAYRGDIDSVKYSNRLLIPVGEIDRVMQEHTRPRRKKEAS